MANVRMIPTNCPVCLEPIQLISQTSDNYWRCPDAKFFNSDSQRHNFEYVKYNDPAFQIILYFNGFKIYYWHEVYPEPLVHINKDRTDRGDGKLFRGKPDFDWSKILTDFPAVRKKLNLWMTFD